MQPVDPVEPVEIVLNGEPRELPGTTSVGSLLEELGLDPNRVAVEINRRILKRAEFGATRMTEGDEVEVVTFVGGG
jgi:thiamine biosynthesis protein ThiS